MAIARGGNSKQRSQTRALRARYAQAFLTTCNLPDTLDRLLAWVGEDPWSENTAVDRALGIDPSKGHTWTAPARVGAGDIAFFHFAARATARVVTLRRAAAREGVLDAGLTDFLDYAADQATTYAGRIFAYGILGGPAEPEPREDGADPHWRSRLYAPIASVHALAAPLLVRDHTDVLTQPTKTITELSAAQFAALKERLVADGNQLTADLTTALPGRDDFDGISAATWREVACRAEQHFRLEVDVRGYFADYLLEELKDRGTMVYREPRCVAPAVARSGMPRCGPARPDYVIRIGGQWLPVETKLSLWAWPDLLDQVAPYLAAAAYEARSEGDGLVRLLASESTQAACLVIDQAGVYVVRDGAFVASDREHPLWSRVDLPRLSPATLRRRLLALLK